MGVIDADYFDGRSARAHPVRLSLGAHDLRIEARDGSFERSEPLAALRWPERQRHGARVLHLADGASVHCADAAGWDAWLQARGIGDSLVVRTQQSWRATLIAAALLVLLAVAGYLWGLPWAAGAVLSQLPESVDRHVGELAYRQMRSHGLEASKLPAARQQQLRERFEQAVARAYARDGAPAPRHELHFHGGAIAVNAYALPGGTIVLGDDLVALLEGHDDTLLAVLGHELGHVEHRHGMRMLVQATLLGAATGLAFGDVSSWLASVPAVLGQLAYSRDFEREADARAIELLRANRIDPAAMLVLFDKLKSVPHDEAGGALASHPADAERRARFEEAGASYNRAP